MTIHIVGQQNANASQQGKSKIESFGDEFIFLTRKYKLEVDGLWVQPGNYIQQMLKGL